MSSVIKFYKHAISVLLLVAIGIAMIFLLIQPDINHYFQGSMLKINLLETTPSPRIIVIGGSNIAFGIDSELMEAAFGVPVINDGLHGGLGVAPLRELREHIKQGDIIIVSLEYTNFAGRDQMNGENGILSDWIEFSPNRIRYLESPWKEATSLYAIMLQRKVNREINLGLVGSGMQEIRGIYTGNRFNTQGDFIGHLEDKSVKPKDIPSTSYAVYSLYDGIFIFLEDFNQYAKARGATVYFEAQSSRQANCDSTGIERMKEFFDTFREKTSIPVVTGMDQLCLPNKYFFDTPFHLNARGRQIRTERLIINLQKIINVP